MPGVERDGTADVPGHGIGLSPCLERGSVSAGCLTKDLVDVLLNRVVGPAGARHRVAGPDEHSQENGPPDQRRQPHCTPPPPSPAPWLARCTHAPKTSPKEDRAGDPHLPPPARER